jgi:hypothetical protein
MPIANTHIRRINYTPQGQLWAAEPSPQRLWVHLRDLRDTVRKQEAQIAELQGMVMLLCRMLDGDGQD